MELLMEGLRDAARLILYRDRFVLDAAMRSLLISSGAVAIATLVGLPLGTWLARSNFWGRRAILLAFRAAMAMPTVFIGIVCYALFSRSGPMATWNLLYTPWAILAGEVMLALPLIVSMGHGAIKALDARIGETARVLGAGPLQRAWTLLSEARTGVILAILTAFARCVTELGIAMMVGGNLEGRTRTLATATALETAKGAFGRGLAMGLILLLIATSVTLLIVFVSQEGESDGV